MKLPALLHRLITQLTPLRVLPILAALVVSHLGAQASVRVVYDASYERATIKIESGGAGSNDRDAERFYAQLSARPYYDEGAQVKEGSLYRQDGSSALDIVCNFAQVPRAYYNCTIVLAGGPGTRIVADSGSVAYIPASAQEAARLAALFNPAASAGVELYRSGDGKLRVSAAGAGGFGIYFGAQ